MIRKPPLVKAQTALKTKKIKYGEKLFLIWRMEFLHPAMWHDHDIDFFRWCTLQRGMWLWNRDSEFTKWRHPAMSCMALGWHAIEFAQTSAILNSTSGFHFHTSPRSTRHSVPPCEILSKSDHPRQKKMTSCRFSRWHILDCRDPIMGSLKSPIKLT